MTDSIIRVEEVKKSYGDLEVLKGATLNINTKEIVSITGASGAGKSTLLHIIGSLDKPSFGKVFINNIDVFALSSNKLAKFRNKEIGFIFQFHYLLPEFTALENVMLPALIAKRSKKEAEESAKELLALMKLDQRLKHRPNELSGGEQQRVAVARALINNPSVVLADEPSGNLDTTNAKALHELFFNLRDKLGKTFVIVTHSESLAEISDRKIVMSDGMLCS